MTEHEVRSTPPSQENKKPLPLLLSRESQEIVADSLVRDLRKLTYNEVMTARAIRGGRVEGLGFIEQVEYNDKMRKVYATIARNLVEEIAPIEALYLGLTNFIPVKQLRRWANWQVEDNGDQDLETKIMAQYFLKKRSS